MTKPAFTPGPWFVDGCRVRINKEEAHTISRYNPDKSKDENIAVVWFDPKTGLGFLDAHLIAAAPCMYEALGKAHDALLTDPPHGPQKSIIGDETIYHLDGQSVGYALDLIRAAIAKAEGCDS